jgi:GH18 family chitinase
MVESLEPRVLLASTELIRNGGFEGAISPSDWSLTGDLQADSRYATVHQGSGYAYLATSAGAAANSLAGSMTQQVTIPANTRSLTFSFWTRINTNEPTANGQRDVMTVRVLNSTGTAVLQSVATLSNLDASASYVKRTFSLARSLVGQTVRIAFDAATDAANTTVFRVDTVALNAVSTADTNRVVGYLPSYRQSSFSKVDLSALTHINYFSVTATDSGALSTGNVSASNLNTVVAAAHAAGVTVSITIGPQRFVNLAADPVARATFAANIVNYALTYNLDGIDIDWEPPAGNNVANYALLINDLHAAASPHRLLITAAVNPWTNEIPVAAVNSKMDWLNVMCYDFRYDDNANYTDSISGLTDWTNYGVTKNKIVMGVPFYGRSGTSWSNTTSRTYSAFVNDYYALNGTYPDPTIDSYVDSSGARYYFNGVYTMARKAAYVRDNGYGGMMIWELGQDYWDPSGNYNQYSLLPILKTIMKPPTWLTPTVGSSYHLVGNTLRVINGTVNLNADVSATHPNLNVNLRTGTQLVINTPTQRFANVNIESGGTLSITAGSSKTLLVTSLSIGATGKLNINNNRLVVDYTGASPIATLLPKLLSGRNGGNWNGNGIHSSAAAADPSKNAAIGYAEASSLGITSFGSVSVDATSLVLRQTYYGDTDLNGAVDGDDLSRTDRGFARNTPSWLTGDFDYDNALTAADYTLIHKAFAASGPVIEPEDLSPTLEPVSAAEPTPVTAPSTLDPTVIAPVLTSLPRVIFTGPTRARLHQSVIFKLVLPTITRTNTAAPLAKSTTRRYAIDWNGDGRTDQIVTARPGTTVRVRHAFKKAGTYRPIIRQLGNPIPITFGKVLIRVT